MADRFLELLTTDSVRRAQEHYYGHADEVPPSGERDALGQYETEFIASRDSFYIATVTENGWPYIQHRGGPPGFLRVLDEHSLGFADYRGNRQLISTGNLATSDRVACFFMDYPRRTRLKLLGHARVEEAKLRPDLVEKLVEPEMRRVVERVFLIDVESFDWNCPKYITPRYTAAEIEEAIAPMRKRIAELEAALAARDGK